MRLERRFNVISSFQSALLSWFTMQTVWAAQSFYNPCVINGFDIVPEVLIASAGYRRTVWTCMEDFGLVDVLFGQLNPTVRTLSMVS
ncbi:hypothetical protein BRC86_08095 [Halobacteriales archaeon QS_3_64_16]|nr:MAG: hypothetical protein BRC86_08095 [Halobacteriales archaeon QS_3_64_16]